MALESTGSLDSIRELLGSPGLRSMLTEDALSLLCADYKDADSFLSSVLSSVLPLLATCGGAASRRSLVLGQIVSWGEAGQRLLFSLLKNDYKPAQWDCECAGGHESPLRVACRVGNRPAITALMDARGRLKCDKGESLGEAAVTAGQLEVVQLLAQSEEIEVKSKVGLKLLTLAVQRGDLLIARYLLRRGANLPASLVTQLSSFVGQLLCTLTESEDDKDAVARFKSGTSIVQLQWKGLALAEIQESWLTTHSLIIKELNVSKNQLLSLPSVLFTDLKSLKKLIASDNLLAGLGSDSKLSQCTSLVEVNVSRNNMTHLSSVLFTLPSLTRLNASHNHLRSLPSVGGDAGKNWSQSSLRHLNVSHNKLEALPLCFKQLHYLMSLDVSHNKLRELPSNWGTSVLEELKASHNVLTEFPVGVEVMLSGSLKELDLSYNQISEIPWSIPQLVRLTVLNLSHNHLKELPPPTWWMCSQLEELNLSENLLDNFESDETLISDGAGRLSPRNEKKGRLKISQLNEPAQEATQSKYKENVEFPVNLFKHSLKRLKLDHNRLVAVPDSVFGLLALSQLSLSNNPLSFLPNQLGSLSNCWSIELQGLDLVNVPDHVRPGVSQGSTKRLLAYLRAQLRQSVPYLRVKLMVVGLQKRGKTSLLKRLRGEPLPPVDISTVGVDVAEWELPSGGGKGKKHGNKPPIILSTWDLAGQDVYYATHQCFLSNNTLYMAVLSLKNDEVGVEDLKVWLLNIQARAPDSFVIVVATHKDKVPGPNANQRIAELLSMINDRYRVKGFPHIIAIRAVSNLTGEGIPELQADIQYAVTKIQDHDTKLPLIERLIPSSYLSLEKTVSKEAQLRRESNDHGILEQNEFLRMAAQNEDNDIHDEEELHLAAKFLHEAGVLLHYNDQLRGLANLYFIDPSWLIDLLAEIVTVQEKQSFIKKGFLNRRNVPFLLRSKRYPVQYLEQYLQLLQRFEIALMIDSEHLLVPSMLPVDKPDTPGVCSNDDSLSDDETAVCGAAVRVPSSEKERAHDTAVQEEQLETSRSVKRGAVRGFGIFFTKTAARKTGSPTFNKRRSREVKNEKDDSIEHGAVQLLDDPKPRVSFAESRSKDFRKDFSVFSRLSLPTAALLPVLGDEPANQDDSNEELADKKETNETDLLPHEEEDGTVSSEEDSNASNDSIEVKSDETDDEGVDQLDSSLVDSIEDNTKSRPRSRAASNYSTRRYYLMSYVPSGFWSRLIVRLLVNLERAGFGRPFSIGDGSPRQQLATLDQEDDDEDDGWLKPKKQTSRSSVDLWRTGVFVVHGKGQFVVEALKHATRVQAQVAKFVDSDGDPSKLEGINVVVRSRGVKDFSAMGYVVDQIDGLIEDWFPGLTEVDLYGEPLIRRFIPWKVDEAALLSPSGHQVSLDQQTHLFKLTDCAKAIAAGDTILCPIDGSNVPLSDLVPDLVLADIPQDMHINTAEFDFSPIQENLLGAGGAGEVYRGTYQGHTVAVKLFGKGVGSHDSGQDSLELSSLMLQLRGEDMVALLKELRQEAIVLSHLKHPCVVGLVGVSICRLCLVMELAPKKSLHSVLDEKVHEKRRKSTGSQLGSFVMSTRIDGVVLGNELTYRIAYQIVRALEYLHSKSIIYRDLKPDNVLVWSLSLEDAINIKLSDYGISRFASPSGMKGEEQGTPGFLAPEAMRRKDKDSAFDEKVDIFSFGMVLFQLLCGVRPYSNHKEQEINRAVYSGERPELRKYVSTTCFPRLEKLMYACWQTVSYERPSASAIILEMKDPSFSCLQQQLPKPQDGALSKIDCVFARPQVMSDVIGRPHTGRRSKKRNQPSFMDKPWILAHSDERKLSVLNTELGVFQIKEMRFQGRKVIDVAYVDNCMWMAVEVHSCIEVVAQPLAGMPKLVWVLHVPAPVLALTTTIDQGATAANGELVVDTVIAALGNGTLCKFVRVLAWEEVRARMKANPEGVKDSWKCKKGLVVNTNTPIHSMVVVLDQSELWCTSFNQLFIVQLSDFEVVHSIPMFTSPRSQITWLVADKQTVYGIDKRAPFVLQWNIATRQLIWILDCSRIALPVDSNVCVLPHEDVYIDIMNRAGRIIDLANVTKSKLPGGQKGKSASVSSSQDRSHSVWSVAAKGSKSLDCSPYQSVSSASDSPTLTKQRQHPVDVVLKTAATASRLPQRITSLLIVKDTLWVARGMGDIIILRRDTTGSGLCPVVGRLRAELNPDNYGNSSDQKLALVDNKQVVASQYLEPRHLPSGQHPRQQLLAVYAAWGSAEFEKLAMFQHRLREAEKQHCE